MPCCINPSWLTVRLTLLALRHYVLQAAYQQNGSAELGSNLWKSWHCSTIHYKVPCCSPSTVQPFKIFTRIFFIAMVELTQLK